jgi:AmmeMemoRadiSam system protein B/AmmeMemoRadiSam system protein A
MVMVVLFVVQTAHFKLRYFLLVIVNNQRVMFKMIHKQHTIHSVDAKKGAARLKKTPLFRSILPGVLIMTSFQQNSFADNGSTRIAAVAGTFYPVQTDSLRKDIAAYLSCGTTTPLNPQLLICPHAGYVFSGPVAGMAYSTISKNMKRVILIGPSHYQHFEGIALTNAEYYQTPLGKVNVDVDFTNRLRKNTMAVTAPEAEIPEHCIEVQIPFLQVQLSTFTIVPILIGKADPEKIAQLLFPLIDDKTLVIASSDLSHYLAQSEARAIDDKSIETILAGNTEGPIDGCGQAPIRVIMSLAKKMNLTPIKMDARTSFETAPQYGSSSRVVGYASFAYIKKNPEIKVIVPVDQKQLTEESKRYLVALARTSLDASVKKTQYLLPKDIPAILHEKRGCFVTLTINGTLRGCIGYIDPIEPLYKAVVENARNAALRDSRFSPVTLSELNQVSIEISVLTLPQDLPYADSTDLLHKLRPNVDGVILQKGPYKSTFLPQVWEQLPDKIQFLQHLAVKAGMQSDHWKCADVKIYQVEYFEE